MYHIGYYIIIYIYIYTLISQFNIYFIRVDQQLRLCSMIHAKKEKSVYSRMTIVYILSKDVMKIYGNMM